MMRHFCAPMCPSSSSFSFTVTPITFWHLTSLLNPVFYLSRLLWGVEAHRSTRRLLWLSCGCVWAESNIFGVEVSVYSRCHRTQCQWTLFHKWGMIKMTRTGVRLESHRTVIFPTDSCLGHNGTMTPCIWSKEVQPYTITVILIAMNLHKNGP